MGASMARNLVQNNDVGKKNTITVFDLNKDSIAKLVEVGAKSASSVAEVAQNSNIIITMLPATQHVRSTLLGAEGVFANAPKGSLIIDSSTIDPLASRDLNVIAKEHGHEFIDAPVSGGVTGAFAGTLTFMVGGSESALNRAKLILSAMGRNIVHCGDSGAGGK
jgi:3-hydroxyisobutyrate dehydrogenase